MHNSNDANREDVTRVQRARRPQSAGVWRSCRSKSSSSCQTTTTPSSHSKLLPPSIPQQLPTDNHAAACPTRPLSTLLFSSLLFSSSFFFLSSHSIHQLELHPISASQHCIASHHQSTNPCLPSTHPSDRSIDCHTQLTSTSTLPTSPQPCTPTPLPSPWPWLGLPWLPSFRACRLRPARFRPAAQPLFTTPRPDPTVPLVLVARVITVPLVLVLVRMPLLRLLTRKKRSLLPRRSLRC
jgi:hypothetical protein